MIVLMAGPLTKFSCWSSIFAWVLLRIAANSPPENEANTVRTMTIFIISFISIHLSNRFGSYFVKKRG